MSQVEISPLAFEIFRLLGQGKSVKEVAWHLKITELYTRHVISKTRSETRCTTYRLVALAAIHNTTR